MQQMPQPIAIRINRNTMAGTNNSYFARTHTCHIFAAVDAAWLRISSHFIARAMRAEATMGGGGDERDWIGPPPPYYLTPAPAEQCASTAKEIYY